jgi:hypothetical protein
VGNAEKRKRTGVLLPEESKPSGPSIDPKIVPLTETKKPSSSDSEFEELVTRDFFGRVTKKLVPKKTDVSGIQTALPYFCFFEFSESLRLFCPLLWFGPYLHQNSLI